eukprot:scaffold147_cov113-Cylindrotheca_fusiformis.AAC.4
MGTIRKRQEINKNQPEKQPTPSSKRQKTTTSVNPPIHINLSAGENRPKSKKELRAEKKAARKAVEEADEALQEPPTKESVRKQKQRLKREQARELLKEQLKQERQAKKIRQQKRLNREINAPKSKKKEQQEQQLENQSSEKSKKKKKNAKAKTETVEEQQVAMKVLGEVIRGSQDDSGMITARLGVQYKDIVIGTGATAKEKSLVTVQYKLTGGKFGAVLDSSKNFKFRVGKGEVIQGWDIGLVGMQEGGRRKLIVPPKAGYGSQDIGAGPGGLLYFDITLLSVRAA